jgi:hypothetical protein
MNGRIAQKFAERGFADVRPFHLSVLANMNLGDTPIRDLVDRAQITDNGVRELVADLDRLGYLKVDPVSPSGSGTVSFTDDGWELMLISFNIQKELEAEFKEQLSAGDVDQLRRILGTMFDNN